jgi:5'(3')-deoxyribonucleotidase
MRYKAFLDMDGVLDDFVGAVCTKYGIRHPYHNGQNIGVWDFVPMTGISDNDFWNGLDYDFWANIPKTPEADKFVDLAIKTFGFNNVAVLTSPSKHEGCIPGKRDWLHKHYPFLAPRMIPTKLKNFFAHERFVLIDDASHNVNPFREAGGKAILVPRPWNEEHHNQDQCYEKVEQWLQRLMEHAS